MERRFAKTTRAMRMSAGKRCGMKSPGRSDGVLVSGLPTNSSRTVSGVMPGVRSEASTKSDTLM
ncbi:MAG: hypothetical protein JRJ64_14215 [Deltaproteobacteria bacterium]|nr:hypothetical protein [Deltaproteobacteria bacterium]